jgi:hypothetical protein
MSTMKKVWRPDPEMGRIECEAEAELAAEMAAHAASTAVEWSRRSGVGEDDAAEAVSAAIRARVCAERAMLAESDELARLETAAAWAATESALEADERVVEAIARELLSAA